MPGPKLRFSPYAWAKIIYMRDAGDTEVGGFGILDKEDPLLVIDFHLIKQDCTSYTVELDEEDTIKFAEEMDDLGYEPWQYQNCWIHSHPGNSASPSQNDEENFQKNFSHSNWAIFFIVAKGGDKYCRVKYNVGPKIDVEIEVAIDYAIEFDGTNFEEWEKEHKDKVTEKQVVVNQFDSNFCELGTCTNKRLTNSRLCEIHNNQYKENGLNEDYWKSMFSGYKNKKEEPIEMYLQDGSIWFWVEDENDMYQYDILTDTFYNEENEEIDPDDDLHESVVRQVKRRAKAEIRNGLSQTTEKGEICVTTKSLQ